MPDTDTRRRQIELPWRTILKVLAAALLVWLLVQLVQVILLLLVSLLLAVTLDPVVRWLERRHLSRGAAATIVSLGILLMTGGFLYFTWASLVAQWEYVVEYFTKLGEQLPAYLPESMRGALQRAVDNAWSAAGPWALAFVQSAGSAVTLILLGFVLTIYMLAEGERTYRWLLAFVPVRYRARMERTVAECREVMFAYVVGNVITSAIAAAVTLVALLALGVPTALLLALFAGLCDFVPVVGFFVSLVPAILLALLVSPKVALAVVLVYILYNTIENYVLAPWAYGRRMNLSNLAVILAFVIGAGLAGVTGALLALPLAAIYPTIERQWLRDRLPEQTVPEHQALETDAEP